jgi:hypothetical protein
LLWPGKEAQILYWSNFLQLIFLPVITVGSAVLGRKAEARAVEDHHRIAAEFQMLKQGHRQLHAALAEIQGSLGDLLQRSGPARLAGDPPVSGTQASP